MPQINTGYWVRIVDDKVKDVWSSAPADTTGWREAIEIFPDIEPGDREVVEGHIFDITKDPVEIIYQKRPVSWEERRDSMIYTLKITAEMLEREKTMYDLAESQGSPNPMPFDQEKLDKAVKQRDELLPLLEAATSHEDVDKIKI